jgi:hypothetical protein
VHLYSAEGMSDDDLADAAHAVTGAFVDCCAFVDAFLMCF